MKTYQLSTKAYCAGISLNSKGVCVETAPILKWLLGKGERWIKHHCAKHNIRLTEVEDDNGL